MMHKKTTLMGFRTERVSGFIIIILKPFQMFYFFCVTPKDVLSSYTFP